MPGFENRFFCRQSSSLEDGDEMVHEFMDYLFKMAEKLQTLIPKEITDAAEKLNAELEGQGFSKSACQDREMMYHLNNYKKLSVYGFNSGKFYLKTHNNSLINLLFSTFRCASDDWIYHKVVQRQSSSYE